MKGKVVLVTGASRGIGRATPRLLAAEGATVAVNCFQSEGVARTVVEGVGPFGVCVNVLAVASDHSRFVTGCYIPVSGGLLML